MQRVLQLMKTHYLTALILFGVSQIVSAFDTEKASTERFKVAYVESEKLPPLTEISKLFFEREDALKNEKRLIELGVDAKTLDQSRLSYLRDLYFPIRVTDTDTGNTYEVQKDRRTIVAKTKEGKLLWKVNPYEDAKLEPYRMKHPIIKYFGKTANQSNLKGLVLGIEFNSSQFGDIELESGKFHFAGND